jgi:hypothetical protein
VGKWPESPETRINTGFFAGQFYFQKWPNGQKKWPEARFSSNITDQFLNKSGHKSVKSGKVAKFIFESGREFR